MVATSIMPAGVATWLLVEAADKGAEADRVASDASRLASEAQQLTEYVTTAIEATFSYNYTDLAETERAVAEQGAMRVRPAV